MHGRSPNAASPPAPGHAAPSAWNITDHLPLDQVIVEGHRGVGALAEENTVEAFELAWQMGLHPESDLRMTKDGVIVPFHDQDFSRVIKDAPAPLKLLGVEHLTFAELAELGAGLWNGVPFKGHPIVRMATIFELMQGRPERHLYMDIKRIDLPRLATEVMAFGLKDQLVLASPEVALLQEWRALIPGSATLLWLHGNEAQLRAAFAGLAFTGFADVTQVQLHVYPKVTEDAWAPPTDASPPDNPFRLTNTFLREAGELLRAHGVLYQAFPWTDDPGVYAQLLDLGVMSLATDHPRVALRELQNYYAERRVLPSAGR